MVASLQQPAIHIRDTWSLKVTYWQSNTTPRSRTSPSDISQPCFPVLRSLPSRRGHLPTHLRWRMPLPETPIALPPRLRGRSRDTLSPGHTFGTTLGPLGAQASPPWHSPVAKTRSSPYEDTQNTARGKPYPKRSPSRPSHGLRQEVPRRNPPTRNGRNKNAPTLDLSASPTSAGGHPIVTER